MILNHHEFNLRERGGFSQNIIGNAQLAQIMEQASIANQLDTRRIHIESFSHQHGIVSDLLRMAQYIGVAHID